MPSHHRSRKDDLYDRNARRLSRSRSRSRRQRYIRRNYRESRSNSIEERRQRYRSRHNSRSLNHSPKRCSRNNRDQSRRQRESRSPTRSGNRSQSRSEFSRRYSHSCSHSPPRQRPYHGSNIAWQHSNKIHPIAFELSTSAYLPNNIVSGNRSGTEVNSKLQQKVIDFYQLDAKNNDPSEEPFDKERIHREMEEKLRAALAKEGKVYPPPKPEASHPVFANDGSFLEIFKKMQEQQHKIQMQHPQSHSVNTIPIVPHIAAGVSSTSTAAYVAATAQGKVAPPPPLVGRRRGGKILKTGMVAKAKVQAEESSDPKDFWSLYLAEVNKYKTHACESETGNRPLVK